MTNRGKIKTGKSARVIRKTESPDKEFERMLELYTMVPPPPLKGKKKKRSAVKKTLDDK